MRPERFETFVVKHLAEHPAVARAAALRDAGDTTHPYGVALQLTTGAEFRWQITAQSAPGEAYDRPEVPVEGDPAPGVAAPESPGNWGMAEVETLLAHALTAPGCREFAGVQRWSLRDGATEGSYGVTVHCHNGATLFLRRIPAPKR